MTARPKNDEAREQAGVVSGNDSGGSTFAGTDFTRSVKGRKHDDRRAAYLATVPPLSRGIVAAAFEGAGAPRRAIKAKCLTCANFDRHEIERCAVITCPLHAFRPYTGQRTRPAKQESPETIICAPRQRAKSDNGHPARGRYHRDHFSRGKAVFEGGE